jgi:hypothetical protein
MAGLYQDPVVERRRSIHNPQSPDARKDNRQYNNTPALSTVEQGWGGARIGDWTLPDRGYPQYVESQPPLNVEIRPLSGSPSPTESRRSSVSFGGMSRVNSRRSSELIPNTPPFAFASDEQQAAGSRRSSALSQPGAAGGRVNAHHPEDFNEYLRMEQGQREAHFANQQQEDDFYRRFRKPY